MLVPTMPTMGTLFCSSTSMTPMWAKPRVPPPERTSTTPASADRKDTRPRSSAHKIFLAIRTTFTSRNEKGGELTR